MEVRRRRRYAGDHRQGGYEHYLLHGAQQLHGRNDYRQRHARTAERQCRWHGGRHALGECRGIATPYSECHDLVAFDRADRRPLGARQYVGDLLPRHRDVVSERYHLEFEWQHVDHLRWHIDSDQLADFVGSQHHVQLPHNDVDPFWSDEHIHRWTGAKQRYRGC